MFASEPGYQQPTAARLPMGGGMRTGAPATGGGYYAPPSGAIQGAEDYAGAQDAYRRALVRYNQQRTGLLRQYGYAGDINPESGMVQNLRVDAGNAYGGLQQLLHNQAQEDEQARYGAEDRGLHGGLANQAESELAYAHHGQSSNLANTLLGNLSDLDSQQLDAKGVLDQTLWQLMHSETQNAVDQGDFNPADLSGATDYGHGPVNPRVVQPGFAKKPGQSAARALAARSQALNAKYGLGSKPAANAYTSGKKKRG